jgi:hypothetical protein
MRVFALSYMSPTPEGRWSGRFLGVYSSQTTAALAVERLGRRPGFKEYARGFPIDCVELDEDFEQAVFFKHRPHRQDRTTRTMRLRRNCPEIGVGMMRFSPTHDRQCTSSGELRSLHHDRSRDGLGIVWLLFPRGHRIMAWLAALAVGMVSGGWQIWFWNDGTSSNSSAFMLLSPRSSPAE